MRLLTIDEVCERALRKIGSTAIREGGSRAEEMIEARYWFDMVIGRIAARKRTWWLVPKTATFLLRPGVWSYDLNQIMGPEQAQNGIQAVIDVWLATAGVVGPDAYPNVPGWLPVVDGEGVYPQVERNGLIRLGHVRRREWEGIQVVDLAFGPAAGQDPSWALPPGITVGWCWSGTPPCRIPAEAPPWWNPNVAWPPASWPPSPWPFTLCPPAPPLPSTPPTWWNPAYAWPPPACPSPFGGTQHGAPRFVYVDRAQEPLFQVSPAPDWGGPYTIRLLFQTYSPDFVSAQGNSRLGMLRETWNLCIVTLLAKQVGNGPVRKLPADEVREMEQEGERLLGELEAYDDEEQAGPGRVAYYGGI